MCRLFFSLHFQPRSDSLIPFFITMCCSPMLKIMAGLICFLSSPSVSLQSALQGCMRWPLEKQMLKEVLVCDVGCSVSVTNTVKASLQAVLCSASMYSLRQASCQPNCFPATHLNLDLSDPCWFSSHTAPKIKMGETNA